MVFRKYVQVAMLPMLFLIILVVLFAPVSFATGFPPTISGISPNSGPTSGGQTVVITGSNFVGVTQVGIAGTSVSYTVNSPNQITAITPPFSTIGSVSVTVATAGATALAPNIYTYSTVTPQPTISGISPNSGPTSGGQTVVITGANFVGVNSVSIAGTSVSYTVNSATQITATTPPFSTAQSVSVAVGTARGTALVSNAYTYSTVTPQPTITSISPNNGPTSGGQTVVITGANFVGVTSVGIAGTSVSYTVNSPTQITATTPSFSTIGSVSVTVATARGTAFASNIYTYSTVTPQPTISSISPNSGPTSGGQTVVISGANFVGVTSVGIAGTSVPFTVNSPTQITATTPPFSIAQSVSVTVAAPRGTALASNIYTYTPGSLSSTPTITRVSPNNGTTEGGQAVTITGTNLDGASSVTFGGTPAEITSDSSTQIIATPGAHSAGLVDVSITTPSGTANDASAYTYVQPPAPTMSGVSPDTGPVSGGQTITIAGDNFNGVTSVTFGGIAAAFTVISPTQITAIVPYSNSSGIADITVTTPYGSDSVGYIYTAYVPVPSPPTITSISPSNGSTLGGQTVTVTGTNLNETTSVTFGGTAATFTVDSPSQITATTPSSDSAGMVEVVVATPSGNDSGSYAYYILQVPQPTIASISPSNGSTPGGQTVTIAGTNLDGATSVTFGGTPAEITSDSPTQITVTTPAHSAGTVAIAVVTSSGTATDPSAYTFESPSESLPTVPTIPTITSVSPSTGLTLGGENVTITGTDLAGTSSISFGGSIASISSVSPTQVIVTTPAHPAGIVDIIAISSVGNVTDAGAYAYLSPSHDQLLAKIQVGTPIPSPISAIIRDGEYQAYVVTPETDMHNCSMYDGDLQQSNVEYAAVITINDGTISSVTKRYVARPTAEICIFDDAINEIITSTDFKATVMQDLRDGSISYHALTPKNNTGPALYVPPTPKTGSNITMTTAGADGNPCVDCQVSVTYPSGNNMTLTTDQSGEVTILIPSSGPYTVSLTENGTFLKTITFNAGAGQGATPPGQDVQSSPCIPAMVLAIVAGAACFLMGSERR